MNNISIMLALIIAMVALMTTISWSLLKAIVQDFAEVAKLLDKVSISARRQTRDVKQSNQLVNQLNSFTQDNMKLVKSATQDSVSVHVQQMQQQLRFFRLKSSPADVATRSSSPDQQDNSTAATLTTDGGDQQGAKQQIEQIRDRLLQHHELKESDNKDDRQQSAKAAHQ